jgi:hypothetical protein
VCAWRVVTLWCWSWCWCSLWMRKNPAGLWTIAAAIVLREEFGRRTPPTRPPHPPASPPPASPPPPPPPPLQNGTHQEERLSEVVVSALRVWGQEMASWEARRAVRCVCVSVAPA